MICARAMHAQMSNAMQGGVHVGGVVEVAGMREVAGRYIEEVEAQLAERGSLEGVI